MVKIKNISISLSILFLCASCGFNTGQNFIQDKVNDLVFKNVNEHHHDKWNPVLGDHICPCIREIKSGEDNCKRLKDWCEEDSTKEYKDIPSPFNSNSTEKYCQCDNYEWRNEQLGY